MHASIIVFSALVAVSAAQYHPYFAGVLPMNPYTGTPLDTPEVASAKHFHAAAHADAAARSGVYLRKRREAPTTTETEAAPIEEPKNHEKRALLYSGYYPGYTAYSAAYYPHAYSAYPLGLWRKKRDVSAEEKPESDDPQKQKRFAYGYGYYGHGAYSPYGYSSFYRSAYPYWG